LLDVGQVDLLVGVVQAEAAALLAANARSRKSGEPPRLLKTQQKAVDVDAAETSHVNTSGRELRRRHKRFPEVLIGCRGFRGHI